MTPRCISKPADTHYPTENEQGTQFKHSLSRLTDTVVVEDASRFARDLVAQELGVLLLIKRGVRVWGTLARRRATTQEEPVWLHRRRGAAVPLTFGYRWEPLGCPRTVSWG